MYVVKCTSQEEVGLIQTCVRNGLCYLAPLPEADVSGPFWHHIAQEKQELDGIDCCVVGSLGCVRSDDEFELCVKN